MIDFGSVRGLTVPEGKVKSINRKSDGLLLWKGGYKNWVPCSMNPDGTIYNDTGYKDGYRIRSGGAETGMSTTCCTGFIPLKAGDTLRIYPAFTGMNTENAINFADENFGNLGQVTDKGTGYGICTEEPGKYKPTAANGISVLTLTAAHDSAIRYVRITNHIYAADSGISSGSEMIVTVNEGIPL